MTAVGNWKTEAGDDTYAYCEDKKCLYSDEHEYAFDGQVFYKKKQSNTN